MESFVDRETALKYIDDAFITLQDKKRLLRTPITNFYGVGGIGKTWLLKKVQQRCRDEQLRYIWVDASRSAASASREFARQVQYHNTDSLPEDTNAVPADESISATKTLLRQGPVVILFDSVDPGNREQQRWLETLLRNLSDDDNLFVVLASKRALSFENERRLARKLTTVPLHSFDRPICETYLNTIGNQSGPEVRHMIFTWTRGYPLALSVIAEAINNGLDPRKEHDQKAIVSMITTQVLQQHVLTRVDPAEQDRYLAILSLLSVPRHFNLVILQDLIEQFIPRLAQGNSLGYFGLPREINQATDVLWWNPARAGFSVEAPVRAMFLLKLRIEQPELHYAVHSFLAQTNKRWAADVSGTDQVHYLCEYLYHSIYSEGSGTFATIMNEIAETFPESFTQFSDEIAHDEELQELMEGR